MELTADQTQLLVWLLERTFARHPEGTVPAAIRQLATQAATDIDGATAERRLAFRDGPASWAMPSLTGSR